MTAEHAANEQRRYATFVQRRSEGGPIVRVGSGANVDAYHWTEVFMRDAARQMDALRLHYYTFPGTWEHKGPAPGFDNAARAPPLAPARPLDEQHGEPHGWGRGRQSR